MQVNIDIALKNVALDFDSVSVSLNLPEKRNKINLLDIELLKSDNWSDNFLMGKLSREKSTLVKCVEKIDKIQENLRYIRDLINEVGVSSDLSADISSEINLLHEEVKNLRIQTAFSGECDLCDAFLEINPGAGGTDSQDFAEILIRMYRMWADKNGFKSEIVDIMPGEEAGIKNATLKFSGDFAYGWLKAEIGVHRLVRISPFNSNGKRQTSFVGVFAYPVVDDKINIEIKEVDLKIDTYRSSGAGGQHVNKTESAVRITHIPTKIVAACQSQRSQVQNREHAIKMLKSRIYEMEMRKKMEAQDVINSAKLRIDFGSQIRNYVMHPYQIVKDLRSNFETGNIQAFLDGDIKSAMESVIFNI